MQSILRTRKVKESAELYERILEAEGMPVEFPNDERVSFAALDEVVPAGPEETDGDAAEEGAPRLRAGDDLSSANRAVVERIKAAGWAATAEEVRAHPDQIERLADAGVAYLRACGKRVVLAMAGATVGDVRRAAARAKSSERGTRRRPERWGGRGADARGLLVEPLAGTSPGGAGAACWDGRDQEGPMQVLGRDARRAGECPAGLGGPRAPASRRPEGRPQGRAPRIDEAARLRS